MHRFCTVRHTIDQYLSLTSLPILASAGLTVEVYLKGCLRFAELCAELGFVRYEDFTRDPDTALRSICAGLALPFDAGYKDRWPAYTNITGDTAGSRGGTKVIRPIERRPVPQGLVAQFSAHDAYHRAKTLLGYDHD